MQKKPRRLEARIRQGSWGQTACSLNFPLNRQNPLAWRACAPYNLSMSDLKLPLFDARQSRQLVKACSAGDIPAARLALDAGADPNFNARGEFWPIKGELPLPLHMAFRRNDPHIAKILIDAGASIDARSDNGAPMPLWLSQSNSCAKLWLEAGGDPWRTWSYFGANTHKAFAHVAARGGSKEVWRAIAQTMPPDPDLPCSENGLPSSLAELIIQWNNLDAIAELSRAGWIPNASASNAAADHAMGQIDPYKLRGNTHQAKRALRLCSAFAAAGAPEPDFSQVQHARMTHRNLGEERLKILVAMVEAAHAQGVSKAIRNQTGRSKKTAAPKHRL